MHEMNPQMISITTRSNLSYSLCVVLVPFPSFNRYHFMISHFQVLSNLIIMLNFIIFLNKLEISKNAEVSFVRTVTGNIYNIYLFVL